MIPLFKPKKAVLYKPCEGNVIDISLVSDVAFSSKMVGEGFAIMPQNNVITSPVDGKVILVFPTKHAIGIMSNTGLQILVHIGFDTVSLNGQGFDCKVQVGDSVKVSTPLVTLDKEDIQAKGFDLTTSVVITNKEKIKSMQLHQDDGTKALSVELN